MILFFNIDVPDVFFVLAASLDVIDCSNSSEHRVVLVVVTVLTIATNEVEIIELVGEVFNLVELLVGAEVRRVGFFEFYDSGIEHFFWIENVNLLELFDAELGHFFVTLFPDIVLFAHHIFHADPDLILIFDQVRAPVVEYL